MIRKGNRFVRPKKPYELARIKEENVILGKYGLKTKREIWKMQAKVDYFRKRAKALAKASLEEQEVLFEKLRALGLDVKNTADVLALKIDDILNRRLQTVVFNKKMATTPKHARQMIIHKKVMIDGKVNNTPSYIVPLNEENKLTLRVNAPKKKKEEPKAEATA